MELTLILIFVIGYLAIAFEHPLKINKTAPALLIGVLTWTAWVLWGTDDTHHITEYLSHHLSDTAEILFFLMGAMTIVEVVDSHQGFKVITNRIKTKDSRKLLWIISILAFFMSAVLDNLTATIVMVSLLRRLVHDRNQRIFFVSMVVVAANAGGAWSPIGDVTTTMLWIGGQITASNIIMTLIVPSIVCMAAPLIYLGFKMKGEIKRDEYDYDKAEQDEDVKGSKLMFFLGVGGLLFVPIFKTITHLPPYMGMLLSLSVVWIVSELLHIDKTEEEKKPYTALHALTKIDVASVLFFLGILLAITALESTHILQGLAKWMNDTINNDDGIVVTIGLLSAIVDNVPLVAASQGMYALATETVNPEVYKYAMEHKDMIDQGMILFTDGKKYYLQDARLWEFIAYCAGTGGSALIIGSAAGVAAMGMEKIDFMWYAKRITLLALIGYAAGILAFFVIQPMFSHF